MIKVSAKQLSRLVREVSEERAASTRPQRIDRMLSELGAYVFNLKREVIDELQQDAAVRVEKTFSAFRASLDAFSASLNKF